MEKDTMGKTLLVIATRNKGKVAEFREMFKDFPVEIKSLLDFGSIPQAGEDGETFDDNAYKKSSLTAKILGIPVVAEDSGLVVEALDGAPGLYSARYAGEHATDEENIAKLLKEMKDKTNRAAYFVSVISVAVPSGPALTYEGRCEGLIAETPSGKNGFGYDPVFYYPPLKKTFAEMSIEEKNAVSHRGKALAELKQEFDKALIWIKQRLAEVKPPCGSHNHDH
jgi:XTP/dITP diphosphohydrolase